jgi:hypothetical protein
MRPVLISAFPRHHMCSQRYFGIGYNGSVDVPRGAGEVPQRCRWVVLAATSRGIIVASRP